MVSEIKHLSRDKLHQNLNYCQAQNMRIVSLPKQAYLPCLTFGFECVYSIDAMM
jgi:hypothetical protein